MFQRPRLKTFLTVFPISQATWGVRGAADELWRLTFRGQEAFGVLTALLPLLNGAYTLDAIFADMAAKGIARREVDKLLQQLLDASLLEDAEASHLPPEQEQQHASAIAFFSRYTSEGGGAFQARLRASRVAVLGEGELADCVQRQLLDAGVGTLIRWSSTAATSDADGASHQRGLDAGRVCSRPLDAEALRSAEPTADFPQLFVVCQDIDDTDLLEAMDVCSKKREVPWLLIRSIESTTGWVGPLFIPRDTACYLSLDARLRGNLPYFSAQEAFYRHRKEARGIAAAYGGLRAFADLMASVATIETIKYLSGFSSPTLAGRFLTFNFLTWDVEMHEVLRVPGVGLDTTRPDVFAWKEMPSDALKGEDFEALIARRS